MDTKTIETGLQANLMLTFGVNREGITLTQATDLPTAYECRHGPDFPLTEVKLLQRHDLLLFTPKGRLSVNTRIGHCPYCHRLICLWQASHQPPKT